MYVCVFGEGGGGGVSQLHHGNMNFSEDPQTLGWPEEWLAGRLGVFINPMKCCLCL